MVAMGNIIAPGNLNLYPFSAQAGVEYDISVDLTGQHPLPDSVLVVHKAVNPCLTPLSPPQGHTSMRLTHGMCSMQVYRTRAHDSPLAMNDDSINVDGNSTLGSNLRWTAPETAQYFFAVRGFNPRMTGTYSILVRTEATGGACHGGTRLTDDHGTISFTSSQYVDNARCDWTVQCRPGALPTIDFTSLDTEAHFGACPHKLHHFAGAHVIFESFMPQILCNFSTVPAPATSPSPLFPEA